MSFFKELGQMVHDTATIISAANQPQQVIVVNTRQTKQNLGIVKIDWTEKMRLVNNGEIVLSVNNGRVHYKSFGFFKGEGTLINPFIGARNVKFTTTIAKITGNMRVELENSYFTISID